MDDAWRVAARTGLEVGAVMGLPPLVVPGAAVAAPAPAAASRLTGDAVFFAFFTFFTLVRRLELGVSAGADAWLPWPFASPVSTRSCASAWSRGLNGPDPWLCTLQPSTLAVGWDGWDSVDREPEGRDGVDNTDAEPWGLLRCCWCCWYCW